MRTQPLARLLIALMIGLAPTAAQPPPQINAPQRAPGTTAPAPPENTDRAQRLVPVPSIIGTNPTEAERRLVAVRLVLQPEQRSPPAPESKVARQNPEAGRRVPPGTRVVVTFEQPPPQLVPVPSIIGANPTEAQRRLAGAHLLLQPEQRTPLLPNARVVRQSPQPGARVPTGTRITATFEISQPRLVPVPSIIGDYPSQAEQRLAEAQLVLRPEQWPALNPDARVVRQNPQPGQQVPPGTQVVATFEAPPPQLVSVPSIIGADQAEAERLLAIPHLVLQLEQRTPTTAEARVVRQNPQAGQQVPPGTQVVAALDIPIPQHVSVPSIIGADVTEAQRRVAATKLVLQPEPSRPSAANAKVVRQSPQPGQQVQPGTQVVATFEVPPPQLVSVPSIIDADMADARRRLAAAQLELQPEQQMPSASGAKVVRQNPEPGRQVPPDTKVVATFEVLSTPWATTMWLGGALAFIATGALVGLWRWVGRMRKPRSDLSTSSPLHVHARTDSGRPSILSNTDPAGSAFGIRMTRPPPVITLTEHDPD